MGSIVLLEDALKALRAARSGIGERGKNAYRPLMDTLPAGFEDKLLRTQLEAGHLAVPESALELTQAPAKFSDYPGQLKGNTAGIYSPVENQVTYNRFLDQSDKNLQEAVQQGFGYGVGWHEYGHGAQQNLLAIPKTPYDIPGTIDTLAGIRSVDLALNADPGRWGKSIAQRQSLPDPNTVSRTAAQRLVYNTNPLERSMSMLDQEAVKALKTGDPKIIEEYKKAYPTLFAQYNKDSLDELIGTHPDLWKEAKKYKGYVPVPALAGVYSLTQPKEGNTATEPIQAKSNIDTTPWANAGVENIPEGVRKVGSAVATGAKALGGAVGKVFEDVGRSAVKIADQGRSGKEFKPEPKDYVNVGMAALNPATKGGMFGLEVAYDWFHSPAETEANIPDPATFTSPQEIVDAQTEERATLKTKDRPTASSEQDAKDFFTV